MHIDPLSAILWALDFVATSIVLYTIFRLRLGRLWPSLVTLFSVDLITWVALLVIHRHYRWYFYTYWIWSAVDSGLRLWVLGDCVRSIPGAGFIPRNARLILGTAAVALAGVSSILAFHSDGGTLRWVMALPHRTTATKVMLDAVLIYNSAACFAALTFCVGVFAAVALLGLGWERRGARIASGLALGLVMVTLRSVVFSESSLWQVRAAADYLVNLSHLVVLAVWFFALLGPRAPLILSRPKDSPIHSNPFQRRAIQRT